MVSSFHLTGRRQLCLALRKETNGVNPEAYIADVLMAVEETPSTAIASLTPWAWGATRKLEADAN